MQFQMQLQQAKFSISIIPNPTAQHPRILEEIVAFARKYEILLVHDLCYAELAFDGYQPTSLLEIPGAKEIGVSFIPCQRHINMAGVGLLLATATSFKLRTLKTNLDYGILRRCNQQLKRLCSCRMFICMRCRLATVAAVISN